MARNTRYDLYPQLSEREQDVYTLLVTTPLKKGEIAKKLHISTGTVNSHVTSILRKKNVNSTRELVIQHYRNEKRGLSGKSDRCRL